MIEAIAAQAAAPPPRLIELAPALPQQPAGAEGNPAADFEAAMRTAATEHAGGTDVSPAVRDMLTTLDKVNGEAKSVHDYAAKVETSGNDLTPGEIVNLTMRCQEFMFHCQLTSNIANRSSDGVAQLFKQQG